MNDKDRIENNFTYHPPDENQTSRYNLLRKAGKALAYMIEGFCPPSRERSVALAKLEESIMWANAAIARNENHVPKPTEAEGGHGPDQPQQEGVKP